MLRAALLLIACLATTSSSVWGFPKLTPSAGDWPWWRGPNRNGVADASQKVPVEWSETQNVIWKVPIPGRGHSSPTVVGDRIYLATADRARQVQGVIALNRTTGKPIWNTKVSQGGLPKTHRKNTHASPTIACDGERLFAAFHHDDKLTLSALNLEGKPVWEKTVGSYSPKIYEYGYAPSPLLYDALVIIAADYEKGGYLVAYNREDGKEVWRQDRPKKYSFSSPVVASVAGRDQLLLSGCELVASYDPQTGKLLWSTPGTTMATCGTMVWSGDLVVASGGYPKSETICVKADGSKEVVWRNGQKCYEQSMIVQDGHVYAVTDRGIGLCIRIADGRVMWQQRLRGPVSASPVSVGDTIYQPIEDGTTFVFKANPERFEPVAQNKLGQEAFATPVICGNRIYIRTANSERGRRQEYLYCLGFRN